MTTPVSPFFEKIGPLINRPEGMPEPGPYYTSLVDLRDFSALPYDFALYCSTDHHPGEGGIWLFLCKGCPTEAGIWLSYDEALASGDLDHLETKPKSNPILLDPVQGNGHTETPHAQLIDGKIYLSYHKNNIPPTQATLLATSTDGLNFERIHGEKDSVVLRYDTSTSYGDGHTGYFRWGPNPYAEQSEAYCGYSLHGGGKDYFSCYWVSEDAIHWKRKGVLRPIEGMGTPQENHMLIWHEMDPASIRKVGEDTYLGLCCMGNRASGSDARITEIVEVTLAGDGITLLGEVRPVLEVAGELESNELASPTGIWMDGTYHLIYVGAGNNSSVNTIMGAKGKLSGNTERGKAHREHILNPEK
mgnify:CR=1 FL=1